MDQIFTPAKDLKNGDKVKLVLPDPTGWEDYWKIYGYLFKQKIDSIFTVYKNPYLKSDDPRLIFELKTPREKGDEYILVHIEHCDGGSKVILVKEDKLCTNKSDFSYLELY